MNGIAVYGVMLIVFGLVFWRRTRAMVRPVQGSGIKIIVPVLYLLPGFYAFANLHVHVEFWKIGSAVLVGVVLALPLIWTTNYEIRKDGQIYAEKNKTFIVALLAIVIIRIALRQFLSNLDPTELMMLYFTVAFSYVVPWRIVSFIKFLKIKRSHEEGKSIPIKV